MADASKAVLSAVAMWLARRNDDYTPPLVRGMSRVTDKARKRDRILDDDELRAVWRAAGENGFYGDCVKLLLLTGQRRAAVLDMKWDDVDLKAGIWVVPQPQRAKSTGGSLKLPAVALDIIRRQPRLIGNDYVFVQRGINLGIAKTRLDTAAGVSGFTIHDLRRCARSLMARAGVRPDIAERVLGHAIGGVEGIYDRHQYLDEKGAALAKLAALIEVIVSPTSDNVVPLVALS
jgi:integrase